MIKIIKTSLLLICLNLTNGYAETSKEQNHLIQQTLNQFKEALNQHQFKSLSPMLSQEFRFQDYAGEMGLMVMQQIVNQYPNFISSIDLKSVTKDGHNYKVTSEFNFEKSGIIETEIKDIILDNQYKILQADIVNIQLAGHQPTKKQSEKLYAAKSLNYPDKLISPFSLVGRLIMVKAQVNGIQGEFMVDSGSTGFVLNSNQFPELAKIAQKDDNQAYGVGGKVENQKLVVVDNFGWQSLQLKKVKASLWDLSKLEKSIGHRMTGIIGADILSQFTVEIDYKAKQIILISDYPQGQWQHQPHESLNFKMIGHIPVIEVQVAERQLLFGIDSGAEGAMLMTRWEDALNSQYEFIKNDNLKGIDGNTHVTKVVRLNDFKVGEQSFKGHQFVIADIKWGHESIIDGLLGYEFLSSKRMAIDYKNKKIHFWN
jgi:hypothetical protein